MPTRRSNYAAHYWRRFDRFIRHPLPKYPRFYGLCAAIILSLLFRQPTRGFIWASIAAGVAVAIYLRWRQREPEINDPKID